MATNSSKVSYFKVTLLLLDCSVLMKYFEKFHPCVTKDAFAQLQTRMYDPICSLTKQIDFITIIESHLRNTNIINLRFFVYSFDGHFGKFSCIEYRAKLNFMICVFNVCSLVVLGRQVSLVIDIF